MKVPISASCFIDLTAPIVSCQEWTSPRTGALRWRFQCRYCRKWHSHGVGAGHRQAHCTDPASPYHATGYNLLLDGEYHDD